MKRTKKPIISIEKQQLILEALGSESFLSINKNLLSAHGPELAVYISNIVDKYRYFLDHNKLAENGSFFLTYEHQNQQTGMSEHQLRKCKNTLKKMGILYTEMRGIPPKEFYFLDLEMLVQMFLINIGQKFEPITIKKFNQLPSKNLTNIKDNKSNNNKSNNNKNLITPQQQKTKYITPGQFEDFWNAYPRHVDMGKTLTVWNRICQRKDNRPTWREIKKAILQQKKSERWQDKKFIPHPTTWLNQSRWLDDPKEMTVRKDNKSRMGGQSSLTEKEIKETGIYRDADEVIE